jgi:hypothetical protein
MAGASPLSARLGRERQTKPRCNPPEIRTSIGSTGDALRTGTYRGGLRDDRQSNGQTLAPLASVRAKHGLGVNCHELSCGRGLGDRLTILAHTLDVELDRFVNECLDLFARRPNSYTAWKIRNVGAKARRTTLDDNQILHA